MVLVTEPQLVLHDSPADFATFVRILASVIDHWSTPIDADEWWDRLAVPFNVILATNRASATPVRERWCSTGAVLADLA